MADNQILQAPTIENNTGSGIIVVPEGIEMLRVGLLGVVVGIGVPLLTWLLQQFLISPIFCHESTTLAVCSPSDLTTFYVSTIILGVIAIALMANWQVFRPLLIAVAAASALWGFRQFAGDTFAHAGFEFYVTSAILYALAYLLFYWLLRLKGFTLSVVLTVVAVILIRWALLG